MGDSKDAVLLDDLVHFPGHVLGARLHIGEDFDLDGPVAEHHLDDVPGLDGLTGLGGKKDFAPHQLGHALSEKFDVYHGESLTAIWSSWARYVLDTDVSRFARFARNVWGVEAADDKEAAPAGIAAQEAFFRSIGMPVRIPALFCGRQDEAGLADLASRCSYGRTRTIGTFRVLGYDDILAIYQLANNEE